MKIINKIINSTILIFIISCTSTSKIPKQHDCESSVIAITVGGTASVERAAWAMFHPLKIFFIRLDNDDKLINKDIIECSRNDEWEIKGNTMYLFNVKPGKYAAIAAQGTKYTEIYVKESKSSIFISQYANSKNAFVIFSEQLIKSTIVDVAPGTFVYMGGFLIDSNIYNETSDGCDEIQKYYYNHFSSLNKIPKALSFLCGKKYFCGSLKEEFTNKEVKVYFLLRQLDEFKNTPWEKNIKRTIFPNIIKRENN